MPSARLRLTSAPGGGYVKSGNYTVPVKRIIKEGKKRERGEEGKRKKKKKEEN
jgi:hypothetical protein